MKNPFEKNIEKSGFENRFGLVNIYLDHDPYRTSAETIGEVDRALRAVQARLFWFVVQALCCSGIKPLPN